MQVDMMGVDVGFAGAGCQDGRDVFLYDAHISIDCTTNEFKVSAINLNGFLN